MGSIPLVWVLRVTAAAVLLGAAPAAAQGEPTVEEVRAWFLKALDEASEVEPLGEVRLTIETEHLATASDAQLAEWRREVRGKPQHPLRLLIETEERRREHGPDRTVETYWFLDEQRWRRSTDVSRGGLPPLSLDTAQFGDRSWQLATDRLIYYGPGRSAPNDVVNRQRSSMEGQLGWLLTGGLHRARLANPGSLEVGVADGKWTARLEQEGWRFSFRGRWDADSKSGLIEWMEERGTERRAPVWTAEVAGWRRESALDRMVASQVVVRSDTDASGATTDQIELREVKAQPRPEITSLLQPPDALGSDPVRGELQVKRLLDYRPEVARVTRYDAETGALLDQSPLQGVVRDDGGGSDRLRLIGWISAASLAVMFVFLRFRSVKRPNLEENQ